MNQIRVLAALFAVLLFVGCTSQPAKMDPRYEFDFLTEVDRISTFHVQHWQALDDRSLIVGSTRKHQYLLILSGSMPDLRYAYAIGISSTGSTIHARFDCVETVAPPCAVSPPKVSIRRIYRLDSEEDVARVKTQIKGE